MLRVVTACAAGASLLVAPRASAANPTRATKGPYLTALSATGADVRFELDGEARAVVEVSRAGVAGPARAFEDRAVTAMHEVHVTGLDPATRYDYVVRVGSLVVGRGHVTTTPKPGSDAPLDFVVFGDDRSGTAAHAAIVRQIESTPAAFLINTGDVVADGGNEQYWQTFFDIEGTLLRDRPMFLAIGNHELYDDAAGAHFARYFGFAGTAGSIAPKLYGTARLGNARFFFLNGGDDFSSGEERQWLDRELSNADAEAGLVWRIAVVHHGPWSSGPHGGNERLAEAGVPQLLARHKVDLVLSGHDHIYERGDSGTMKYVVSGGGGAPLYRIGRPIAASRKHESTYHYIELTATSHDIRLVATRVDGSMLDRCGFSKGGPWDCDPPPTAATAATRAAPPMAAAGAGAETPAVPAARSGCGCSMPGVCEPAGMGSGAGGIALFEALGALFWPRRGRRRGQGLPLGRA